MLRKRDSQFMWVRLVSLSWATFVKFLNRSDQFLNVAWSNVLIWIIISDWIFFGTCLCSKNKLQEQRRLFTRRFVYHVHLAAFGICIRFKIKISNKFFEKILGEWTISKAEKPVIKFGEKGKRQGKRAKSWDLAPVTDSRKRKTFEVNYTHKKNCQTWFLFFRPGLCPPINKCSSTIKLYPCFFVFVFLFNFYYQCEKSHKWTHWFNRDNY